MAGLDGIENKIHPGDPMDKDLYDLPPEELAGIPTVCGSLREAIAALARTTTSSSRRRLRRRPDRGYHRAQDGRKHPLRAHPHPVEFDMYYRQFVHGVEQDPSMIERRPRAPVLRSMAFWAIA
jgi:glutamine synthetase